MRELQLTLMVNQMGRKGNIFGKTVEYVKKSNGTSIGRRPKTSSMNKNRRRQLGKKPYYRGQGR